MYRGGAEKKIRKYLIDNNYIDCIIQMPENLFFGVTISVCIMVLKKNKTENNTLFIDAARECKKVTNANKLEPINIDNILKYYIDRTNVEHVCTVMPNSEIGSEEYQYDLSVSNYVKPEEEASVSIEEIEEVISYSISQQNKLREKIENIIRSIGG
jgi:type I restriction enzyme M protein